MCGSTDDIYSVSWSASVTNLRVALDCEVTLPTMLANNEECLGRVRTAESLTNILGLRCGVQIDSEFRKKLPI